LIGGGGNTNLQQTGPVMFASMRPIVTSALCSKVFVWGEMVLPGEKSVQGLRENCLPSKYVKNDPILL